MRAARERAGLTLRDLAAKLGEAGIVVTWSHLARMELGQRRAWGAERMRVVERVLGVEEGVLLAAAEADDGYWAVPREAVPEGARWFFEALARGTAKLDAATWSNLLEELIKDQLWADAWLSNRARS